MNLIEAWKMAKEGQRIKRFSEKDGYFSIIKRNENTIAILSKDLLADDWEIEKEKKVVVIEDVVWRSNNFVTFPSGGVASRCWSDLEGKPPMKITLEWEE